MVPEEDTAASEVEDPEGDPQRASLDASETVVEVSGPRERELGEIARDECNYEVHVHQKLDLSSSEEESLTIEAPPKRPLWKKGVVTRIEAPPRRPLWKEGVLTGQPRRPAEAQENLAKQPRKKPPGGA